MDLVRALPVSKERASSKFNIYTNQIFEFGANFDFGEYLSITAALTTIRIYTK